MILSPSYGFSVLGYSVRCLRARWMAWLAAALAVGCMLSLAAVAEFFVLLSSRSLSEQAVSVSRFQVYLADGARPDQVATLEAQVRGLAGVRAVSYESKQQALAEAQRDSGLNSIVKVTGGNPFPASLVVTLANPGAGAEVTAAVAKNPAVDQQVPTSYTPSQARRLDGFFSVARALVVGLGVVALFLCCLATVILLRGEIRARKPELRILTLLGTPRIVIRLPLVLEALSVALLGSAVAAGVLVSVGGRLVPVLNWYLPFLRLGDWMTAARPIALLTLVASVTALGISSCLVRLPR